jgi:hypothetical protein
MRLMQASALFALSLLILAACQTKSGGLPSDVTERQETLVTAAKAEVCRGQVPTPVPVTPEGYASWPLEAKQYVRGNLCQWASACDRETFHRMDCPQ